MKKVLSRRPALRKLTLARTTISLLQAAGGSDTVTDATNTMRTLVASQMVPCGCPALAVE